MTYEKYDRAMKWATPVVVALFLLFLWAAGLHGQHMAVSYHLPCGPGTNIRVDSSVLYRQEYHYSLGNGGYTDVDVKFVLDESMPARFVQKKGEELGSESIKVEAGRAKSFLVLDRTSPPVLREVTISVTFPDGRLCSKSGQLYLPASVH